MKPLFPALAGALLLACAPLSAAPQFAGALLEPGVISTAANEYNYSESADGSLRLFARAPKGFEGAQIYLSQRQGNGWSAPRPIDFADPRFTDSDPFLTRDGDTLYFVSNRLPPGQTEKKDLDIWRSHRVDGKWQAPEHLAINSDKMELGVELHGDTLYFNSNRDGGPAKMSIYAARAKGDGFAAPVALAAPFNAGAAQGDFTLSPDGAIAVFWSKREDGVRLYAARRQGDGWGAPVKLGAPLLPPDDMVFTPAFSPDGASLTYAASYKAADAGQLAPLYNGELNVYRVSAQLLREALGAAR